MKKYISQNTGSTLVYIDTETTEVESTDRVSTNIDWLWVAPCDGVLDEVEVKEGDIIIKCYPISGNDRETFVVKDEALKDYYKRYTQVHNKPTELNTNVMCDRA